MKHGVAWVVLWLVLHELCCGWCYMSYVVVGVAWVMLWLVLHELCCGWCCMSYVVVGVA